MHYKQLQITKLLEMYNSQVNLKYYVVKVPIDLNNSILIN